MSRKRTKPSADSSALVPQAHGGALRPGAGGGAQPGSGRPPSKVREAARLLFEERLAMLAQIADDKDEHTRERLAALKMLADVGGVDKIALTLEEQAEQPLTRERLDEVWGWFEKARSVRDKEKLLTRGH